MVGDLCARCAGPVNRLLDTVDSKRGPSHGIDQLPVLSLEDIAAQKKRGRKKPPESPGNGPGTRATAS